MAMVKLVKATEENLEEAYEVFYRALIKLTSEGKSHFFGDMTLDRVETSMQNGNRIYLLYRKYDGMPVAAISVLTLDGRTLYEGDEERVKEVIGEGYNSAEIRILNAISTRPELWGEGYMRQALRILEKKLKKKGVKLLIGEYHPEDIVTLHCMKNIAVGNKILAGEEYILETEERKIKLRRKRFAFAI